MVDEQPPPAPARQRHSDQHAVEVLYRRHRDAVFRYISRQVSDHATAEDLTSETFLRALRSFHAFDPARGEVGGWLHTIARNLVRTFYSSARSRRKVLHDQEIERPDPGRSPEEICLGSEETAVLRIFLARLTPDQRACLVLRFYDGLTVDETAARLDRRPATVKHLQYRAVRSLANAFATYV
ncbi:RNA polymerase sigma factor [Pseudonocardia sp. WMMC193]|uniref:RNA polymerase sigma factor n=1 Tax=Pseudonocardia sp. WMMC193 TaxID=2911965 RepID=UPI001F014B5D|nr:sigma-70 family RNA polymerase sigma factor [Pseudonocardia sp. WMMC193]MCF7547905.1 sigma-70 family RNA polymerase sigma factor [Pseudonocardia sp. WMMC193]